MGDVSAAADVSSDTVTAWVRRGIIAFPPAVPGHGKAQRYSLANVFEVALVKLLGDHGVSLEHAGELVRRELETQLRRRLKKGQSPIDAAPLDFEGTDFDPARGLSLRDWDRETEAGWAGEEPKKLWQAPHPLTFWVLRPSRRGHFSHITSVNAASQGDLTGAAMKIMAGAGNGGRVVCISPTVRRVWKILLAELRRELADPPRAISDEATRGLELETKSNFTPEGDVDE